MSKRLTDRERLLHKFQQMTDNEVKDILDYVLRLEPATQLQANRASSRDSKNGHGSAHSEDELLALLSAAYENRRALQVFEWETARRRAEMKVGGLSRR